jgi:hypothetical protein
MLPAAAAPPAPPIAPPELPQIMPLPSPPEPAAETPSSGEPPPVLQIRQREASGEANQPPAEPVSPYTVRERAQTVVNRRGEAIPLERRTPEERERYRRQMNLLFALAGLAMLVAAVLVLLQVRP